MPMPKADLGVHGEHLLADDDGNVATEGDTAKKLHFAVDPTSVDSPVIYQSWEHYVHACQTAQDRAASVVAQAEAEQAAAE